MSSQSGSKKLPQLLVSQELTAYLSVFDLCLTQRTTAILSKGCKPDNSESHNSSKLSFTNIKGLRSNFIDCVSFLKWNYPDILAICEISYDVAINSGNFSATSYLPLIQKDSVTHMHSLSVYVKELIHFARDLSLENSFLFFWLTLLHSLSSFFFSVDHLLRLYAQFMILFHLT